MRSGLRRLRLIIQITWTPKNADSILSHQGLRLFAVDNGKLLKSMLKLLTYTNLHRNAEKIRHFSSTRIGGVSTGTFDSLNLGEYTEDASINIARNRELLAVKLGIHTSQIYNAHQKHGAAVKFVDEGLTELSLADRKAALHGYDAFICNLPSICITVTTADCVPILLFDPINEAVAAIHSGWRGTLNNVAKETIRAMHEKFGTKASDLVAAIGPCISQAVYEVGEELYSEFSAQGFSHLFQSQPNGKYLFDIREAVRLQLVEAGITDIEVSPYCTFTNDDLFFSARKSGLNSGRMLSGIFIL